MLFLDRDTLYPPVMAGLDPAIHVSRRGTKDVDARDKPGHDNLSIVGRT
jgi:hypothetical protein